MFLISTDLSFLSLKDSSLNCCCLLLQGWSKNYLHTNAEFHFSVVTMLKKYACSNIWCMVDYNKNIYFIESVTNVPKYAQF